MEGEAKGGVDSISSVSTVSSESDSGEEVFSVAYAASSPAPPPIQKQLTKGGSLLDMSSLLHQLPIKRGLSKHYEGKSRSFTSLSEVTCLEDLAKPENPANKKLKLCKRHAVIAENHPRSKKPSSSKRRPSQKSASTKSSFSNDSALFA